MLDTQKRGKTKLRIHWIQWKGFPEGEATYEPEENVKEDLGERQYAQPVKYLNRRTMKERLVGNEYFESPVCGHQTLSLHFGCSSLICLSSALLSPKQMIVGACA